MTQRLGRYLALALIGGIAVGVAWLSARFILPWSAPFIVAYTVAAVLEIPLRALVKRGWRRRAAAGMLSVVVLMLVVWAAVMLTLKGISAATDFAKRVPELMEAVSVSLTALEQRALAYAQAAPPGVSEYLETAIAALGESVNSLPSLASRLALEILTKTAQASPDTLIFAVTAGLGSYFISAAFPRTNAFILAQLPESIKERLTGLGQNIKVSFGGFLRAQLILMALTFFQLLLGFLLLRIRSAVALAAVVTVIDALPVFGTGIVLVPWALCCLLLEQSGRGVGLLICWAAVNLVRSCTQAKLLGDQIGLDPIASLMSVYVGWRVWGVGGMLIFPIIMVTLQQLNDRGVIKLWKSLD